MVIELVQRVAGRTVCRFDHAQGINSLKGQAYGLAFGGCVFCCNAGVGFGSAVFCKIEDICANLGAAVEVAVSHDDLVSQGLGLHDNFTRRCHDGRTTDKVAPFLDPCLGHTNDPHPIGIGPGLKAKVIVEILKVIMFRRGWVVTRRIVANQDHLGPGEGQFTIGFGPAPVIADGLTNLPAQSINRMETKGTRIKIAFLKVLKRAPRLVFGMSGQMNLAITVNDLPCTINQNGGVEAVQLAIVLAQL